MGAVASSAITLNTNDSVGTASNKLVGAKRRFSIVLSSQGGTAGDITASMLGFATIYSVLLISFVPSSTLTNIGIGTDGTNIFTFTAIDGSTGPANVTGTLTIQVEGNPL
jgi:hypothetical protein